MADDFLRKQLTVVFPVTPQDTQVLLSACSSFTRGVALIKLACFMVGITLPIKASKPESGFLAITFWVSFLEEEGFTTDPGSDL